MSRAVLTGQQPVDEVQAEEAAAPRSRRGSRRRRPHGPVSKAWLWTHRWASLILGLLLLVEITTGAVLLFESDIDQAVNPAGHVVTSSERPMSLLSALRMVQAEHPELEVHNAQVLEGGAYELSGETKAAAVDPGTGQITDIGDSSPWIMRLLVNIHNCGLACEGYPGYQAWLTTPVSFVSDKLTVGGAILGVLGVLLLFLVISGVTIWWPGIRAWVTGFIVRRRRGAYARDLDLHRLAGIIAMPFLFMWAFTGAAFEFQWPEKLYFALLPGSARTEPVLTPGTGPMISMEQAITQALGLHPGAVVTGLFESTPTEPGGSYGIRMRDGFDAYRYSSFSGGAYVDVDSHGGGTADYNPRASDNTPITQQPWDNSVYYGLHFGSIVPWLPRFIWLIFGLTPILLAITGMTIWLTKHRSNRNRQRRRKTPTGAGGPPSPFGAS